LNVLIVDDENLMRDEITSQLATLGMNRIEQASDGVEALERLGEAMPDLIIADIRMPRMDGLELFEQIRNRGIHTPFVVVSGYDLFQYAQQAIRLGAFAYLLKPIKQNELKHTLDAVRDMLHKKQTEQKLLSSVTKKMSVGMEYMRKQFILELATGRIQNERNLQRQLDELDIRFAQQDFLIVLLSLDRYVEWLAKRPLSELDLIKYSLENIATELMDRHQIGTYCFETEDGIGMLLHVSSGSQGRIADVCNEVIKNVKAYAKCEITIGIGITVHDPLQLAHSFEAARKAVMQRLVSGGGRVLHPPQKHMGESFTEPDFELITLATEQNILDECCKRNADAVMAYVKRLYAPFKQLPVINPGRLTNLNFQLTMILFKYLEHSGIKEMGDVLGDEFLLYKQLNGCSSIETMIEWFASKLQTCFDAVRTYKSPGETRLIQKAKEYIQLHYHQDITLEKVAEHVHLSPSYFSRLFKQETGQNFSGYLISCRIQRARLLLRDDTNKVSEIGHQVGFYDTKHFYKLFKKVTGMTPSEYRNDHGNR